MCLRAHSASSSQKWGQQVIVDNQPGANEMIAAQEVARAPGDGYTLLMASDAVFSLNKHLYAKIPTSRPTSCRFPSWSRRT